MYVPKINEWWLHSFYQLPSPKRQVSSSSSSSSSSSDDEEESGSDESVSRSPSPFRHPPPPAPPTSSVVTATPPPVGATRSKLHPHSSLLHAQTQRHHPHHHLSQHQLHRSHTPSSVDDEEEDEEDIDNEEETRALTPASNDSGSTVGSVGGGLKLTISKAVLKQAALSQHKASVSAVSSPSLPTTLFIGSPTDTGGRGSGRGSKGSRRGTYMYIDAQHTWECIEKEPCAHCTNKLNMHACIVHRNYVQFMLLQLHNYNVCTMSCKLLIFIHNICVLVQAWLKDIQ